MSYQGDTDSLRTMLAMLRDEGVLDRVQSIGADGIRFYPPPPPPVSDQVIAETAERHRMSQDAFERHMRVGAAGGIRPVQRKVGE